MVDVVSPTAAVIMGDSLMYVVLPVAVEFGAGEHFGGCGVVLDWAWAQPVTCWPITHAMRRVSTRATRDCPRGPYLLLSDPNNSVHSPKGRFWGQPGWSPIAVAEDLRDRRGQRGEAQLVGDGQLNPGRDGPAQAHQHSVVSGLHEPVYRGGGGAYARGSASSRRGLMRQEEVPHLAYGLGLHVRRLLPGICRHLGFRRQLR